jgi:hypothetical protein
VNQSPTSSPPTVSATETDATTNVVGAEFFIDSVGANGSGTAMDASDSSFDSGTENVIKALTAAQFAALSEGTHTIYVHGQDSAGNWGATQSVTFVKDTVGPVTTNTAVTPSSANSAPTVTATETDATTNVVGAEFFIDSVGSNGSGTAMNASDGLFNSGTENVTKALTATQFAALSEGTHTIYVHGQDPAGNWGATQLVTFVKDTVNPDVTINQASGQSDPTNASTIHFTAAFSEPVNGFTGADVTLSGTAGATTAVVSGGPSSYDVAVSGMTADGTVIAAVPAGGASDAATNPNNASTSTDNTVTWKGSKPSVTINQASGQPDPTNASSVNFTATFSEPVSGFTAADVQLSGSAGATTAVVTGGPTVYNVAVSGMTSDGTVIASVVADGASDSVGNGNTASTSTDNTVTYDTTGPVTTNTAVNSATTSSPPTVTATETDTLSNVAAAEYFIDGVGTNGTGTAMSASDGTFNSGSEGVTATLTAAQFTTLSQGSHTIYVHGKDNAGNWGATQSVSFVKDTVAPSVTVNQAAASDPFGANQADPTSTTPIHFTAIFSEPVNGFGNGSVTVSGTAAAGAIANVYNPSNDRKTWDIRVTPTTAGTITVTIAAGKVTDDAGNQNTASTSTDNTVTYQPSGGTPPSVTIDSPAFGSVYAKGSAAINPLTLNAHFSDPDNGPWKWIVNWDDNGATSSGNVNGTSTTNSPFSATHAFLSPGVYTINVKVTDSNGLAGTATVWIVVYDPNGGFVTGGGWITVGAGSAPANPTLSGRANFGFNSQYKKNANVPTGETEFNFQLGNMDFHSTVYSWLVVNGFKAQYKGTGTINGAGSYSFTLTAYDADLSAGNIPGDEFRIRITDDNNSNAVVFDNRMGSPTDMDTANPQLISGGSIVIHKA